MRKFLISFFSMKALLVFLLTASVILNVFLARKIGRLDRSFSAAESLQNLTVGTSVPPFEAKDLNGNKAVISYSDSQKPTIIYIFTPQCMWCTRNLDNIKALSGSVTENYKIMGVSLTSEDLTDYLAKNQFHFPIYTEPSTGTKTNYKLGVTPKTIVVSPGGQVLKTWNGAYEGDLKSEIENFFHVHLPYAKNEIALTG
jgi:peroxiredoxin